MKQALRSALITVLGLACAHGQNRNKADRTASSLTHSAGPLFTQSRVAGREAGQLILPGVAVGTIRLGDPRDEVLPLFPSGEGRPCSCGEVISKVVKSPSGAGDLIVLIQDGKVVQIDTGTPRYHTADGIAAYDSPLKVRQHYKHLRAYSYSITSSALGDRPVIFWVDAQRGLAFEFASSRADHSRYLYAIIVFPPKGEFCPESARPQPDEWREIAPYSLELPENSV
jgi:hypothetical protein